MPEWELPEQAKAIQAEQILLIPIEGLSIVTRNIMQIKDPGRINIVVKDPHKVREILVEQLLQPGLIAVLQQEVREAPVLKTADIKNPLIPIPDRLHVVKEHKAEAILLHRGVVAAVPARTLLHQEVAVVVPDLILFQVEAVALVPIVQVLAEAPAVGGLPEAPVEDVGSCSFKG
jgi:hypothetical protein